MQTPMSSAFQKVPGMQLRAQVNIGFGDAVTLESVAAEYPAYTVVAAKLYAIALLDMTNSRMKNYLDLIVILEREAMAVPIGLPIGLSDVFVADASRQVGEVSARGAHVKNPPGIVLGGFLV